MVKRAQLSLVLCTCEHKKPVKTKQNTTITK